MPAAIVKGSAHWDILKGVHNHTRLRKRVAENITSEHTHAVYSYIENKLANEGLYRAVKEIANRRINI
jgi:hypothetical protein